VRINNSQDGIPRFAIKIETRVSAYDMAVHLINRFRLKGGMNSTCKNDESTMMRNERLENRIKDLMAGLSQAEVIEMVRESILQDGVEVPHYSVGDDGYSTAVDFLQGLLERKYKGFAKK